MLFSRTGEGVSWRCLATLSSWDCYSFVVEVPAIVVEVLVIAAQGAALEGLCIVTT